MAVVGLKMITAALVDENQKLIAGIEKGLSESGIYSVDQKDMGSKTANITGIEGTLVKIPGNNQIMDAYTGPASPSVAMDINNLAFLVAQKMLGYLADGKGGFAYTGTKPRVALLIETQTLDRKDSIFFGFGNGNVSSASQNIGTDTDTAQTREDDQLTYTALSTIAFGGEPIKKYFTGDENYDSKTMMKEVFGGYIGDYGTTSSTTPNTAPTNNTPDTSTIPITSVTLDKDDVSIKVGGTAKLTPTINPANATDKTGKWSVVDDSVATVGNDGTVTGVKVGTTIITFTTTDGNKTAQATVTVTAA